MRRTQVLASLDLAPAPFAAPTLLWPHSLRCYHPLPHFSSSSFASSFCRNQTRSHSCDGANQAVQGCALEGWFAHSTWICATLGEQRGAQANRSWCAALEDTRALTPLVVSKRRLPDTLSGAGGKAAAAAREAPLPEGVES